MEHGRWAVISPAGPKAPPSVGLGLGLGPPQNQKGKGGLPDPKG